LKIQDDESSEDLDSLENAMQTRDVDDSDDEELVDDESFEEEQDEESMEDEQIKDSDGQIDSKS